MGAGERIRRVARRWALVAAVSVVARLAYWRFVTPDWVPRSDAQQYVSLARALADGRGFSDTWPSIIQHPTAYRPPLYPAVLAPGTWLFGDAIWPLRLVNVGLGTVVAVLAGVLAASIGGRRAGFVTGLAVALYPPLLANDTITLTEPLALALLLGSIIAADRGRWAVSGLCVGLMLLTRPNGYLVVLIVAGWLVWRVGARRAAGFAAVAALCLLPWLVRNQAQVDTFRPVTSDGFTLAATYAPPAQARDGFVDPVRSPAYGPEWQFLRFDEARWNDELTQYAWAGLRDDPSYVARVVARNAAAYFELAPWTSGFAERIDGRNPGFRAATLPLFYVVTAAGVAGLILRCRDQRVRVLILVAVQFTVLSMLTVAAPRLRAPFDLTCCIGLGLAAVDPRVHARLSRARRRRPATEAASVSSP